MFPTCYEEPAQNMLAKPLRFTMLRSQGDVLTVVNTQVIIFVISELFRSVN